MRHGQTDGQHHTETCFLLEQKQCKWKIVEFKIEWWRGMKRGPKIKRHSSSTLKSPAARNRELDWKNWWNWRNKPWQRIKITQSRNTQRSFNTVPLSFGSSVCGMNPLNQQHQYQGGLGNGNNGGSANLATPPPIPTSSPSPHNLHPPPHILTSSANPSPNVQQQQLQLQQQQQQQLQLQAAAAAKKSRSGYKEHELAQIRNSLRPYEQAEQHAAAAAAAAAAASGHQHHLAAAAAAPSLAAAGKQQQLLKGAATSVQTLLKLGFSEVRRRGMNRKLSVCPSVYLSSVSCRHSFPSFSLFLLSFFPLTSCAIELEAEVVFS